MTERGKKIIFLAALLVASLTPLAVAKAGLCHCHSYDRYQNGNVPSLRVIPNEFLEKFRDQPLTKRADCDEIVRLRSLTSIPFREYGKCEYLDAQLCQGVPCFPSSKACTTAADCRGYGGVGECLKQTCFFDQAASEGFKNQPSILGIKADLKLAPTYHPIVKIPFVSFSDLDKQVDSEGYIQLPWIGEFLAGIYKYGIVVASIVASVIIIVAGLRVIMSAGGEEKAEGYKSITHAIIGLGLVWGSYAILYTVSPNLVNFKTLRIKYIEREDLKVDDHSCDDLTDCPDQQKQAVPITKGACVSDRALAEKNRSTPINFSFFGQVDGRAYGKRALNAITKIVIHNGGYTAKGNNDTWQKRPAAAHYTIQRDGIIFQHAGEECVVPHAPGGNKEGIGIEINIDKANGTSCNSLKSSSKPEDVKSACSPTAAQYAALTKLIDDIIKRTSAKRVAEQIVGHCELGDSNGHGDPRAFDWTQIGLDNNTKKTMAKGHACSWYLPF